jgi:hypothetical protein
MAGGARNRLGVIVGTGTVDGRPRGAGGGGGIVAGAAARPSTPDHRQRRRARELLDAGMKSPV